jgi:hypothetical protein
MLFQLAIFSEDPLYAAYSQAYYTLELDSISLCVLFCCVIHGPQVLDYEPFKAFTNAA